MSQLITLPSLEMLLIAGRAVALVLGLLMFAWAFRHWRRAAMRDTQRVFEQLDLVRSELLIMKEVMHHTTHKQSQSNVGANSNYDNSHDNLVGRRTAMSSASERVTTFDARPPIAPMNNTARGYEIAARMARNGAGKDELIRNCGITSHEAELLVKLHGHKQRDQQTANSMDLIGRQARTVDAPRSGAAQQSSAQVLQNQSRQVAGSPRQAAGAGTQRTPSAPTSKSQGSQGVIPRSRLVAVG